MTHRHRAQSVLAWAQLVTQVISGSDATAWKTTRTAAAALALFGGVAVGVGSVLGQAITGMQPGSGAPGTAVEIYGTGFSTTASDNTVKFGGTTATVDSAKSTVIYATVPSGPEGPVEGGGQAA